MANNPFYPGYQPGKKNDENINPLYPGYYTGQPLQRRPSSKNFIKPIEYEGDKIEEALENTKEAVVRSPLAFPRWVVERVADDWKSKYKVSIKPEDIATVELDDYATEDFPGAVTTLNVDPRDWKKDAKKETLKTVKSWVKQVYGFDADNPLKSDFSDIENKVNRELWTRALGYGEVENTLEEKASRGVAKRVAAPFPNLSEGLSRKDNPLNVRDVAVWYINDNGDKVVKKDIYHNTADAAVKFVEQSSNPKNRDKLHSAFLTEAITATNTEIQAKFRNPGIKDRSTLDKYEGAVKLFDIKAQTISDIRNLQDNLLKDNVKDIKKSIIKGVAKEDYASTWEKLDIALEKARTNQKFRLSTAKSLLSQGKISEKSFKRFEGNSSEYSNFLDHVADNVKGAKAGKVSPTLVLHSMSGVGERSLVGKQDVFTRSIIDKLQKDGEYSLFSTKDGEIGGLLRDDNLKSQGLNFDANKIQAVTYRLRRERTGQATTEVLNAINDPKKALERYAWNRITKRMDPRWARYATGEILEDRLKKRNYFGLKIESEGIPDSLKNSRRFKRFERRYGYKVDLELEKKYFGVGKLTIRGGDQFNILKNKFFKKLDVEGDKDFFMHVLGDGKVTSDMLSKKLFGKAFKSLSVSEKKEVASFARDARAYKDWAGKLTDQFGDKTKHGLFKYELFKRVKGKNDSLPEKYKLDRKYIGRLEKINKKMLEIKAAFEKSAIGKIIKTITTFKDMVAEKIAELASKLVAKLIGAVAGSTGILAALSPIIEKTVQFVVKEVVKKVTDFFSALAKGDLDKAFGVVEESAKKFVLGCALVCAPFVILISGLVLLLASLLGSSTSPVDRTVNSTLMEDQALYAAGENPVIRITKSVSVEILETGEVLSNPRHLDNDVLEGGIKVTYKVSVTPKISLLNDSVFFIDEVLARNEGESWKVQNYGTTYVNPFIQGTTRVYELKSIIISGSKYENSSISNKATAYTPEIEDYAEAGSASTIRTFSIGDALPEVKECEYLGTDSPPTYDPNANPIAQRAREIVSNLERGFWCDYNHSNDYPNLWSDDWWRQYGIELDIDKAEEEGPYNLFWCTWLVIKSYQETVDSSFPVVTSVRNMKKHFADTDGYTFTPINEITIDEIQSGDIIFFDGHVSMVYSKTSDSITTVESNNIVLSLTITTNPDGTLPTKVYSEGSRALTIEGIGHKE
ncbi:MAG: hypothetical protein WAX66_02070 [Patescibacteria group bacterium]